MKQCKFWQKCQAFYHFSQPKRWRACPYENTGDLDNCIHRWRGDFEEAEELPENHEAIDEAARLEKAIREWKHVQGLHES